MGWKTYGLAVLAISLVGIVFLYALQRFQHLLPLNPLGLGPVAPDLALNTAVSFVTNTNWQAYGGETTMSFLTQMLGMTVQNFLSAATGMAVLMALIRGFARHQAQHPGKFLDRSYPWHSLYLAAVVDPGRAVARCLGDGSDAASFRLPSDCCKAARSR